MGFRVRRVERRRLAEFIFSFREKSLSEQLMSTIDVELRVSFWIGLAEALFGGSFDFQSKLAEGTFIVISTDALNRRCLCRGDSCSLACSVADHFKQIFGSGVA